MAEWPAIVFGWPAVIAASAAFVLAFVAWPRVGFVAAALAAPFCFWISLYPTPIGRFGGPIALVGNVLAAYLLHRGRRDVAFACLAPFVIVSAIFGLLVMAQPSFR